MVEVVAPERLLRAACAAAGSIASRAADVAPEVRSSACCAPSRPPSARPWTKTAAFMAPARGRRRRRRRRCRSSSSSRSSTPQVKAPCVPPPCRARFSRLRRFDRLRQRPGRAVRRRRLGKAPGSQSPVVPQASRRGLVGPPPSLHQCASQPPSMEIAAPLTPPLPGPHRYSAMRADLLDLDQRLEGWCSSSKSVSATSSETLCALASGRDLRLDQRRAHEAGADGVAGDRRARRSPAPPSWSARPRRAWPRHRPT